MYDYIVIGSGFGGSVSAMRLAEKGYKVLVLEKGRRWKAADFPKSNWNLRKYLWMPALRWFGFLKLDFFRQVFVLSGVGVGGGSLVYANTHMMPKESFYTHPGWAGLADWKSVLAPFYERARFMLGSSRYEKEHVEDRVLKEVADDMGRGETYGRVDYVGVYLGDPRRAVDPYFSGLGPLRKGCTECAGCMVGCRHDAKNTLDKNYLWFAEHRYGAEVQAETSVERIRFDPVTRTYEITARSGLGFFRSVRTYRSSGIVVAAGVLGTVDLLLRQKHLYRTLTGLSDKLGHNIMTNSEMLSGVVSADRKLNHGLAISTIFDADEDTHVELVKFPDGSGSMFRLAFQAAGNGHPLVRTAKMIGNMVRHPFDFIRSVFNFRPATSGIILLIMQTLHSAMRMKLSRGLFGYRLSLDNSGRAKVPSYLPKGQEVLYRYAEKVNGVPKNAGTEILFGMSSTAHILGGCTPGATPADGVVDSAFRAFGYDNFHILDGSVVPCNLGVNPSLTITALAEYAMAQVPEKPGNTRVDLDEQIRLRRSAG